MASLVYPYTVDYIIIVRLKKKVAGHDTAEILLKLALNTNQSIKQSQR
jgi:hypothetical protein